MHIIRNHEQVYVGNYFFEFDLWSSKDFGDICIHGVKSELVGIFFFTSKMYKIFLDRVSVSIFLFFIIYSIKDCEIGNKIDPEILNS